MTMLAATSSSIMMLITSLLWKQSRAFGTVCHPRVIKNSVLRQHSFSSMSTSLFGSISEEDEQFLSNAIDHARLGLGRTFPNPAVGCVLVRQDTNEIIGSGFHPKSGWPHAEVFALLEAAGHLDSGVEAAKSILAEGAVIDEQLQGLVTTYTSEGGPETLLSEAFKSIPVTAYVTLEPCCHHGQTPPCAASLVLANVNRVVVGFRDPNPRVDGGGVKLLQEAGIEVDMVAEVTPSDVLMKSGRYDSHLECAQLAEGFVKRITPKDYDASDYSSWINGQKRGALRRLAGIQKNQDTLTHINWTAKHEKAGDEEAVDQLALDPRWMERVDALLWEDEMINLRLNKAVGKKKLARRLGERIAKEFGAHVAQTVGHTVLLYRPGFPPVLDLDQLVEEGRGNAGEEEEEQDHEEEQEQEEQ